ncbi:hypothetical protein Goklo_015813 [Gossypium klotzschianum]|uniref:non-specific serine/threonine protein kinase n=1 Tax=Gossypium klotzschianum TaxID=34286 RepID=A0A7J8UC67_9ROSI|nr:hypothetical protein [Gossypium klotzschianum]
MERYEIVKDIGSGNFGVAKLARDRWTKELFAVKFIERGHKIDEHVQREIMNHRSLKHPNIVRFKEVLITPTHLAIVMEYAAGGELFERICSAGRFSEDEEICHRDLKLENTLLDGSTAPRVKICDFGYSKRITIPEIRSHPWFLKNLPIELMEGGSWQSQDVNNPSQTIEEVQFIIQEAMKTTEVPKVGEFSMGGSMDLDDLDADTDLDVDTSGDFVCPL